MKKWVVIAPLLLSLTGTGTGFAAPAAQPGITVTVNNKVVDFDVQPVNDQGTVFVKLRFVAAQLGGLISSGKNNAYIISKGTITLSITAGSTAAYKNQQPFTLAAAPRLVNGRLLVPLRVLAEVFEASVTYANGQVAITTEPKPSQPAGPGVSGNTVANLNNGGWYAADEDWIYFSNIQDSGKLYKQRKDGTEFQLLSDGLYAGSLNLMNGKLYYIAENNKFFCMDTDGSNKTLIKDFVLGKNLLSVTEDWIYFTEGSGPTKPLYRMKLDGSSKTLLEQYGVSSLAVYGGRIYYTIDASKLFAMNLDGSHKQKLLEGGYMSDILIQDTTIYFNYKEQLYTMNTDGTRLAKISGDNARDLNLSGNWLYYSNHSEYSKKLFRINLTDYSSEKLADDKTTSIQITGNKLHYLNPNTRSFAELTIE
ncbi:DUF5050 domain-containing protein [Paenibacillus sp. MMS20-IR301]|uniref:DUF5050 domain-containing protein n=1 Tax=Paenibacillus sp. MMS20-IR301 TaxID=2895946 RepID=UPI0028E56519|nr:DUF5050 domain-containing protein [Paenibacillus sp. MMS20-IR301]WNS44642.1 DUF5050 domain-containing protein [Paenibacillus sp. MMS20-IR301]